MGEVWPLEWMKRKIKNNSAESFLRASKHFRNFWSVAHKQHGCLGLFEGPAGKGLGFVHCRVPATQKSTWLGGGIPAAFADRTFHKTYQLWLSWVSQETLLCSAACCPSTGGMTVVWDEMLLERQEPFSRCKIWIFVHLVTAISYGLSKTDLKGEET